MKTVSKGMNVVLVLALLLSTFVFSAAATPSPVSGQAGAAQTQEPSSKIEGALLDALAESGSADFFVVMAEKADLSAASKITDWSARGHYVYDALREVAARTQAPVIKYAEERGLAYRSFLTVNSVYFKGGTLQIAEDLAALPGVDTLRLEGEAYIQPDDEIEASLDAYGWNLSTLDPGEALYGMQAAQVWDTYGVRGENIIVANIDTGAYYQHEALVGQYRGNLGGGTFDHDFNWYMPTYGCGDGTYPCDNDGHGSGTIGIMAGQTPDLVEQIGVAPAASWIACKGCEEYSCSDAALTGCADWMVAPCPIGVDPGSPQCDPDRRPHIVNNSWGGGGCSTWYQGYVQAWVAAGIFPAFSAGNATACNALGSPGDNPEAFGTAAHSSVGTNLYAGGPSCFFPTPSCDPDAHEVDPHLNAPTFGRTADNSSNSYYNLSGTSGASPHTAGAVALMWSASPMFVGNIDDTFTFLEQSANKNVPAGNCGKPACAGANVYPNYEYGWGYLDALAAVEMILANTGDSIITGEVTDVDTSAPLADAMVEAASPTQTYAALTNPDGIYTLNVFSGTYTVTVSAFGYLPAEITDVVATTGMTTTLDVALEMAEWYEVTGTVTDSATGWPLYAKIDIDGYPGPDIWTDPVTGEYGITLPEGIEFTFDVTAWVAGYNGAAVAVGPLTGNEVVDIALDANLEACDAPGYDMLYAYLEDFEVDNGSYVVSGTPADHWQWGVPVTWPSSCASGEHCWGTNLTGNYANNAITVLTSPVIDLSSESAPLTASWWQASYLESATWDQAYAEVSINGGGWQVMWEHTGATAQIDWSEKTYDLSAAAGGNVQFRFRLTSDFTVSYAGYYIDLVTITGASGCQIPVDGGLVVGNVYDYETDDPLVGARVENEAGEAMLTQATPHDPAVDDGFYTLFAPSGDQVFTATMALYGPDIETVTVLDGDTVRQDFYLPVGNLTADPTELHATVDLGSTETLWLTLENTGTGPASWEIVERDMGWDPAFVYIPPFTGQLPPSSEPLSFERAPRADSADTAELAEAIGLLTGAPAFAVNLASKDLVFFADADVPSAWTVVKPAFGSGSYYAGDFAGADFGQLYVIDNDAKQLVSVDTATGNTTIIGPCNPLAGQIWTGMSWDPTTDTMYGSATDGSVATLFTINLATGATTQVGTITGAPLTIDIAVNGDGEMYGVEIAIDSLIWINKATGGATAVGALGFDANYAQGMDFEEESGVLYWAAYGSANGQMRIIDTTTGASAPVGAFPGSAEVDCLAFATGGRTDVPWLTQDPITGTLAMGESQAIEVVFDAGVPEITQPGNYYAQLRVDNDTPYGPLVVPVTMTVSPPSSYGKLDGTVTGLGYCDVNPAPLEGAEVYVQSDLGMSWMVETDADGYYQLWLDEAHSPFTVTVTYPVHETGMATGVDIVGEETTTENFDLRWLQPCVTADPDEFAVTVVLGEQLTETLELLNTGAASTDFEIREKDQGFTPTAGEDVLVVAYDTTAATAMEAALAANGLTYLRVTRDVFQATPVEDLLEYQAVFYAGGYSGDSWAKAMAYLDAGGSFLIADNDLGYGNGSTTFYQQYLQSTYATDAGSDGVLTGVDIMAGINPDISADPYPDDFDVGAEGVEIFIAPTSKSAGVRVERNDYRAVYLAWDYQYTGSTADAEAIVAAAMQFLAAPDVPWLSLDPITGTLAADTGLVFVDVFFDAAEVAEPGIYMAEVQVRSDDPTSPLIVPVAMNVILLDSGRVEGIVTGLGYCDDDPAPLENAEVLIESSLGDTWTRITNEDGWYSQWVDPTHAPLTITVTAAGHETGVAVDVPLTANEVTEVDFDLRWIESCMDVTPLSYQIELPPDTVFTDTLTIGNAGAGELIWEIRETTATMRLVDEIVVVSVPAVEARPDVVSRSGSLDRPAQQFEMYVGWVSQDVIDVLLVTPDVVGGGDISLLLNTLAAFPDLNVTLWNGNAGTPTVADMLAYDVVFVGNDILWDSSAINKLTLSNNLADYIDAGGKVLAGSFVWSYDNWGFGGGRFITDDYSPFEVATQDFWVAATLGAYDPDHPIMAGISAATDNVNHQDPALSPNGSWIASWNDGQHFVAESPNCVGLNQLYFHTASFGGQTGELLHNALLYLATPPIEWIDVPWVTEVPTAGMTLPDSAYLVDVIFDTTGLEVGQCYTASLGLLHDDPGWASPTMIPLELCVVEFEFYTLQVIVDPEEGGSVKIDPDQEAYLSGEVITLTATAELGWMFAGWSGDVTGTDEVITYTIVSDTVITATFEQEVPAETRVYLPILLRNW